MFCFSYLGFVAMISMSKGATELSNLNMEDTDIRGRKLNLDNKMLPQEKIHGYNVTQNILADNFIPMIQKKMDSALVRKSFDEFSMVRKKTHFTLPLPNDHNILYRANYNNDFMKPIRRSNETANITDISYEIPKTPLNFDDPRIYQVLRKQTELIEKLTRILKEEEDDKLRTIQIIEKQDEPNSSTLKPLERTSNSSMTTIKTLIDETEVKNALQNDPYVKRILQMAHRRREAYINGARKFFDRVTVVNKKARDK